MKNPSMLQALQGCLYTFTHGDDSKPLQRLTRPLEFE
jgi:hypothetical protein